MKKYVQSVQELFNSLGGYENISYFTHCMTRMRFHLNDWNKVNDEEIKKSSYATGVNKSEANGEYQIIIGIDVANFYKVFCEINGYDFDGKTIVSQNQISNQDVNFKMNQQASISDMKSKFRVKGWLNQSLAFISKVFAPIVYPLIGYGLLLTVWSLLTVEWTNDVSAQNVHFFEQLASILDILTSTFSLFITIAIGYTVFKAMRCNGIYGMLIAIILTAPGLVNMGDVKVNEGESILGQYPGWSLFGDGTTYPWKINYTGLIIPMILVAIFGAYMERWTNKINNQTAKTVLSPVLIIGVTFIFAVFIMAPIGMLFTNYLSLGVNWLSTNSIAKYIVLPIIGGLYGPLVITGLHHSLTPIILQGQDAYDATLIQGFITLSNISQGVATIAFVVLNRRVRQMKDLGVSNGISAIVGGITEPSLFTVNLKHLYPLIACSIGVFSGTILLVASNTYALQGASSIFGYLMFLHNAPIKTGVSTWVGGGFVWGALSILLSTGVTFTMTIILGKTKFFWNRSREIILEDYHEDIEELKLINKNDFKEILLLEKNNKKTLKNQIKIEKSKLKKNK